MNAGIEPADRQPLRRESVWAWRVKGVGRIKLSAQLEALAARREESGTSMLENTPQPKTPLAGGQRGLGPTVLLWPEAGKASKALSDAIVKLLQSFLVRVGGDVSG